MSVYRLTIEYDGTGWHGWQVQEGTPTIQEAVEDALATALRARVPVTGSGRTDAGVHASGQIAHFEWGLELDPFRLLGQLNGLLPRSVAVSAIEKADDGFHARFGARLRTYRYRTATRPFALQRAHRILLFPVPDFGRMNESAMILKGRHDFSAFCRTASDTKNRVCTVSHLQWVETQPHYWDLEVSADRFLHGMVRTLAGTLLQVGSGKLDPADLGSILESRDRRKAGPAAPARGLTLERVDYD